MLFANPVGNEATILQRNIQLGYIKFFDLNGNLVSHYIPVKRIADNVVGMYDIVGQTFYTSSDEAYATMGGSGSYYKVGDWS